MKENNENKIKKEDEISGINGKKQKEKMKISSRTISSTPFLLFF